jgi:hypothetical protein
MIPHDLDSVPIATASEHFGTLAGQVFRRRCGLQLPPYLAGLLFALVGQPNAEELKVYLHDIYYYLPYHLYTILHI